MDIEQRVAALEERIAALEVEAQRRHERDEFTEQLQEAMRGVIAAFEPRIPEAQ